MCFRCLIFSLSGPCEFVIFALFYCLLFCVALSMDLFVLCVACFTVFVNCLVKQFAICLGMFVIECDEVVVCGWKCSIG